MNAKITVEHKDKHEWVVRNEAGKEVAVLFQYAPIRWRAYDAQKAKRLLIDAEVNYVAQSNQSAEDIARLIHH